MSSKRQKDTWQKRKRLERYGVDADPKAVRIHSDETPLHVCARRLCGYVLQNAGRAWDEEVDVGNGRVDCIDFGDFDEAPLAIEFESNPTQPTIDEKVEKYVKSGPCRDVLILDLRDAPNHIAELAEWIEGELAGV